MIRLIPYFILAIMAIAIPENWGFWPRGIAVGIASVAFYFCVMREYAK